MTSYFKFIVLFFTASLFAEPEMLNANQLKKSSVEYLKCCLEKIGKLTHPKFTTFAAGSAAGYHATTAAICWISSKTAETMSEGKSSPIQQILAVFFLTLSLVASSKLYDNKYPQLMLSPHKKFFDCLYISSFVCDALSKLTFATLEPILIINSLFFIVKLIDAWNIVKIKMMTEKLNIKAITNEATKKRLHHLILKEFGYDKIYLKQFGAGFLIATAIVSMLVLKNPYSRRKLRIYLGLQQKEQY